MNDDAIANMIEEEIKQSIEESQADLYLSSLECMEQFYM